MVRTRGNRRYQSLNLDREHAYNLAVLGISPSRSMSGQHLRQNSTDEDANSEFPSLGPQPQQSSNMSQAWNSTAMRQPQQAPVQQRVTSQQQAQQSHLTQPQQRRSVSAQTQDSLQHEPSALDAQYDGQSTDASSEQPQDDFPPLALHAHLNGRSNGYAHDEAAFGSEASRPARPTAPPGIDHQLGLMQQQPPIGQPSAPQPPSQHSNFAPQMVDAPITNQAAPQQTKPYADMTEQEKFGLPGLLAKIRSNDAASAFTMGVDINSLGLDLDSPDPLFSTFSTPFADSRSRPVIPDFALPAAYSVTNVPSLASRMPAFSDETLFFVFYQNPRDVVQELAAGELYSRDWRWHKELQQWMMKDSQMAAPIRVSERSERGVYIFFDANNWRRERREFVLNYDHLDQRHGATQPQAAL
jgi:CCR4-NOT transcription complex subunit 2